VGWGAEMDEGVYYRIYLTPKNEVSIECMQWFDENDYTADRFMSERTFETEADAIKYLSKQYNVGKTRGFPVVNHAIQNFLGNTIKNILD